MKQKISRKEILNNVCLSVNYNRLDNLLYFKDPDFYLSGQLGWNADIYLIDDTAIITGYRPCGKKAKHVYSFNETAGKILRNDNFNRPQKEEILNDLINLFISINR